MGNLISLRRARLCYQTPEAEVEAVGDVSFDLREREFVALVGPSGCGKYTLLGAIAGLENLTEGTVTVCGQPVTGPSPHIALMPQRDQLMEWRTIEDNALLGLQVSRRADRAHREHVEMLLARYGLAEFARKHPSQLSGGMRQRSAPSARWPRTRTFYCWMSRFPLWTIRPDCRYPPTSGRSYAVRARRRCW